MCPAPTSNFIKAISLEPVSWFSWNFQNIS